MTSNGDTLYKYIPSLYFLFFIPLKSYPFIFFMQIVLVLTEARYALVRHGANSIYSQQLEL